MLEGGIVEKLIEATESNQRHLCAQFYAASSVLVSPTHLVPIRLFVYVRHTSTRTNMYTSDIRLHV